MICYKCTLIFHDEASFKDHIRSHESKAFKRKVQETRNLKNTAKTLISSDTANFQHDQSKIIF